MLKNVPYSVSSHHHHPLDPPSENKTLRGQPRSHSNLQEHRNAHMSDKNLLGKGAGMERL